MSSRTYSRGKRSWRTFDEGTRDTGYSSDTTSNSPSKNVKLQRQLSLPLQRIASIGSHGKRNENRLCPPESHLSRTKSTLEMKEHGISRAKLDDLDFCIVIVTIDVVYLSTNDLNSGRGVIWIPSSEKN